MLPLQYLDEKEMSIARQEPVHTAQPRGSTRLLSMNPTAATCVIQLTSDQLGPV